MILFIKKNSVLFVLLIMLLLTPLVAMQFTNEVQWTLFDFLMAALLLSITVLLVTAVLKTVKKTQSRFFILLIIMLSLLLLWAELAVGVFNTPFSGS